MHWQQMLLPRVAIAGGWRLLPIDQALLTLGLGNRTGGNVDQPVLESVIGRVGRAGAPLGKCAHIMEGESGPDHQDLLVLQSAERFAEGDMRGRVQPAQQRELERGNIRLRVHQF